MASKECRANTRRRFLKEIGAAASGAVLGGVFPRVSMAAHTAPVSLARCESYEAKGVLRALETMMDQIGGLGKLVAGKTVAVKVNMVSNSKDFLGLPANRTYQIHPNVAYATAVLLDRAGAKRIRFLESTFTRDPFEKFLGSGGWNLQILQGLQARVEFEDTRNMGLGRRYHRVAVPSGGSLFPAYELNHSYLDCDVYVSLGKMKNHAVAGVTLSMKNNFGITPTSVYGQETVDETSIKSRSPMFHEGKIAPAAGIPQEIDPASPRRPTYRVPRHIVDSIGIRPIDLAIIDGIETVSGGEGPWIPGLALQKPYLLLAGRNPLCTDAVAVAAMGYDPMATAGSGPFPGDNHLALAASLGFGTHDPSQIEVRGLPLPDATHPFKWEPKQRNF